ncbi:MAG TPA: hypothetical protein VGM81_24645 [Burkholderiaceae bacterium]|jgi:hypothetical protein
MSPIADTVTALYDKAPEAFAAWVLFALLPVLIPALLLAFTTGRLTAKAKFVLSAAVRLLGWPTLFIALLGPPWFAFEVYLAPVILDAYPGSRPFLTGPFSVTHWVFWHAGWFVPVLWICWLFVASMRYRRAWIDGQNVG